MLKAVKSLIVTGGLCAASAVQAVAISDMTIEIVWDTLSIAGPLGNPVSFYDPASGQTLYSGADGWVGVGMDEVASASAINGADATALYNTTSLSLVGGYDAIDNVSGGMAGITNSGPGVLSAWGGGYRGFIYEASATGQVTVSVNYLLYGSVSVTSPDEYANGGYSLFMDASNVDVWAATYAAEIEGGSTAEMAEEAASLASTLATYEFTDWQAIEAYSYYCGYAPTCVVETNGGDVLSLTFDVVAGTRYHFGVDATVGGYTQVSAVPVPAAAWLFGSGLIGLVGMARRRQTV